MTRGLTYVVSGSEATCLASAESVDAVCACMLSDCRLVCDLVCGLGWRFCRLSAWPTTALRAPAFESGSASVVWVTRLAFCDFVARVFVLVRGAVLPLRTAFLVLITRGYIAIYMGLPPIWFGRTNCVLVVEVSMLAGFPGDLIFTPGTAFALARGGW